MLVFCKVSISEIVSGGSCKVVAIRGFLKLQCQDENNLTYYKCTHGRKKYLVKYHAPDLDCNEEEDLIMFDKICDFDPGFYQLCGHQRCRGDLEMGRDGMLCGDFTCDREGTWKPVANENLVCNGRSDDCANTDIDEEMCEFDCRVHSGTRKEFVPEKYSKTPIYRAPIYRVPRFTGTFPLPPNTGFMCKLVYFTIRFTGPPDIPGLNSFPQEAR